MLVSRSFALERLRQIFAGLAILALVVAVVWGGRRTAIFLIKDLYYPATHLNASYEDKFRDGLGLIFNDYAPHGFWTLRQKTPDDAIIGVPRAGRLRPHHWSLLYPRRVVVVDTLEEFEQERPTHILLDGAFPPYTLSNDPRRAGQVPSAELFGVVQLRSPEPEPSDTFPRGWKRGLAGTVEVLAPISLGMLLLLGIIPRWSRGMAYFLALSALLGWGGHTLLLFCLSLAGLPLTITSVLTIDGLLLLIGPVTGFTYRGTFAAMATRKTPRRLMKRDAVLLTLLGLMVGTLFLGGLYWPIWDIDVAGSYDYRAKAIVQQGTVAVWQFFKGVAWTNSYYPFFTTMLHAHHYLLGGSHALVYYSLLVGAFLVVFCSLLRARGLSTFHAMVFTAVLGGNFEIVYMSQVGLLNLPQAVYATLGLLFLLDYIRTQEAADRLLSGLCLGLAGWVRTDSLVILAVACAILLIAGRLPLRARLQGIGILIVCYGLITLPHEFFIRGVVHHDVVADFHLSVADLFNLQKFWSVLAYFARYSFSDMTGYLWLPWLLAVLADWPWHLERRPLLLATCLLIAAWVGLFLLINVYDWAYTLMQLSALRWYANLTPLYVASIAESDLMRRTFDILEGRAVFRVRLNW